MLLTLSITQITQSAQLPAVLLAGHAIASTIMNGCWQGTGNYRLATAATNARCFASGVVLTPLAAFTIDLAKMGGRFLETSLHNTSLPLMSFAASTKYAFVAMACYGLYANTQLHVRNKGSFSKRLFKGKQNSTLWGTMTGVALLSAYCWKKGL